MFLLAHFGCNAAKKTANIKTKPNQTKPNQTKLNQ